MFPAPKPERLRPVTSARDAPDRVAEARHHGSPEPLRQQLFSLLGEHKVLHKISDLVRFASDASPYRFVPQAMVVADEIDDIAKIFRFAHNHGRNVVFRASSRISSGNAWIGRKTTGARSFHLIASAETGLPDAPVSGNGEADNMNS